MKFAIAALFVALVIAQATSCCLPICDCQLPPPPPPPQCCYAPAPVCCAPVPAPNCCGPVPAPTCYGPVPAPTCSGPMPAPTCNKPVPAWSSDSQPWNEKYHFTITKSKGYNAPAPYYTY